MEIYLIYKGIGLLLDPYIGESFSLQEALYKTKEIDSSCAIYKGKNVGGIYGRVIIDKTFICIVS